MALWRRYILGGMMAGILPAVAATPDPGSSGLSWEAEKIVVSAKLEQQDVRSDFVFRNGSDHPVTITSIDTSCSCTMADSMKRTYAPGEKGSIRAIFEAGDAGWHKVYVTVATDGPKSEPTRLELDVEVPKQILPAAASLAATPLAWDADVKDYVARAGEETATVQFHVRNASVSDATIFEVMTTCECTVAKIPRTPWVLKPGEAGDVTVVV
ncbi:MAG TPA: DUF1573 domain-containing protein, partial [Opitutaceae bacterium]|nr:DUF1573 domain-containing protein [Opitutaceae bacterium]